MVSGPEIGVAGRTGNRAAKGNLAEETGWTGNGLVLPNGSRIKEKNPTGI